MYIPIHSPICNRLSLLVVPQKGGKKDLNQFEEGRAKVNKNLLNRKVGEQRQGKGEDRGKIDYTGNNEGGSRRQLSKGLDQRDNNLEQGIPEI